MSNVLKDVIDQELNIYSALDLLPDNVESKDLDNVTIEDVKRKYKKLALLYHPDKNPASKNNNNNNNNKLITKFHQLNQAVQILTNENLKSSYDAWFKKTLIISESNKKRRKLIESLNNRESLSNNNIEQKQIDLHKLQNDGQYLRKLKYFKISFKNSDNYHNYEGEKMGSGPNENDTEQMNEWHDSSTLRMEIECFNWDEDWYNDNTLLPLLCNILKIDKSSLSAYNYSSRNLSPQETNIFVIYLTFKDPYMSRLLWKQWIKNKIESNKNNSLNIVDISPKIPTEFYTDSKLSLFDQKVTLNSQIEYLLHSNGIIDLT